MGGEPCNPASELARRFEELLNDRDFMASDGISLCTEDFVRYDRRKLTAQPPTDRQGWRDAMFAWEGIAGGQWPVYKLTEVLAVRGDRLVALRWTFDLGSMGEMEVITVTRTDEAVDRMEVSYYFDPEDEELAIKELDRLHAELGEE